MDNLFDLNDYEETQVIETQVIETTEVKHEEIDKESYHDTVLNSQAQNHISPSIENSSAEQTQNQIVETINNSNLDDSFETKISLKVNKNLKSSEAKEKCIHAVDDTIDINEYNKITEPALSFPFELDTFQKRSIIRLENHQNVLVCAHTSSGKTVVAEYAIALGRKLGKRVFYTSPIKALSNQKYREFKLKFGDVGILTGDVSINPDSQCIIMTTEILQSSLYKNSEMLNMVEWVVFDEVHYINDNERGHVWEEILILLPPRIGIVMLSATVPNYLDFAKWVGRIKNTTIYIQNTLKRIVPLEHKIFIATKKIFVGRDKHDKIMEENINLAMKELEDVNQREFKNKNNPKTKKEREEYETNKLNKVKKFFQGVEKKEKDSFNYHNNYNNKANKISMTHMKIEEMVNFLFKNELTPSVIFVFSIKKIDEYAKLLSTETRINKGESSKIIKFFDKCMGKLTEEDKKINQIQIMRRILPQGIGVHHAGLLPVLKETIEILYSKGLIKILFATTSFSIGLNMPTRTVVFTEIQKFNEDKKEILSSSEYLQMCGRAGRRGIDSIGHIFLLMGDKKHPPLSSDISNMMGGKGTHVESKFRLSYRTIISFLSRNIKNIMEFFKESYLENNKIMIMPETMNEINEIHKQIRSLEKIECLYADNDDHIRKYYQDNRSIRLLRKKAFAHPEILKKLTIGRMIIVNRNKKDYIAVILHYYFDYDQYRCLISENINQNDKRLIIEYEQKNKSGLCEHDGVLTGKVFKYFEVMLDDIVEILDQTIKIDQKNSFDWNKEEYCFVKKKDLDKVLTEIIDVSSQYMSKQVKIVDYLKTTRNEISAFESINLKTNLQNQIRQSKCNDCFKREDHMNLYEKRKKLEDDFETKSQSLSSENLKYYNDFKIRVNILKKLGYIDEEDQILLKGKAAREIATSDCVLITELLMGNILDKLDISETVAFLCGFTFSKNEIECEDPQINKTFSDAVYEFNILLENLQKLESEFEFEENKYNRRITFSVSKSIYLWMQGEKFTDILNETDLEEGKVYNLIMRLYLFMEEIRNFYSTLGNSKLAQKFADSKAIIMRDIMSCKSLYLQDDIDIDDV